MSRLIVCLLIGVCVATVFAADSPVAPVDSSPVSSGKPRPPIVDNYDRFSLEEDLKPASEHNDKLQEPPILINGSNSDKNGQYNPLVPSDILAEDKVGAMPDIHLSPGGDNVHAPMMTGDLPPAYVVSNSSSGASVNHSIDEVPMVEATTKKTFIMKIPTKSPMLDAMMNATMDNKTMMTDNKTMMDSDKVMQDSPDVMTTMKPGMTTMTKVTTMSNNQNNKSTSSQLVGNNATAPTSIKTPAGSSATIVSPAFIVAIFAMLGSRLC